MQFIAKNISGGTLVTLVFILNRCTCKSKEHCCWECLFDLLECLTKRRAVTFIHNKHNAFLIDLLQISRSDVTFFRHDAQLLN